MEITKERFKEIKASPETATKEEVEQLCSVVSALASVIQDCGGGCSGYAYDSDVKFSNFLGY